MSKLHDDLAAALSKEYQRLLNAGSDKAFDLTIHAHVSTYDDGNMKITYSMGSYGDTDATKGSELHAVVTEYVRRKNWTEANKPMTLIGSTTDQDYDADPQPYVAKRAPSKGPHSDDVPF